MQAAVGDRIVVKSRHTGEPAHSGRVVEVHGPGGTPPYLVEWDDSGRTTLFFPGSDATVEHLGRAAS